MLAMCLVELCDCLLNIVRRGPQDEELLIELLIIVW